MLPRGAGSETKVATASRSRRAHSGIPKLVTVSQQSLVPFQPKERQALVSTMAPADGGAPDAQKNTYSGNDVKDNSRITIRTQNESVTSADNNKLEKFSHITVGDVDMPESNPAVLKLQIELAEGQKKLAQAKSKLRRRSRRNRDDDSDSSD